MADELCLQFVIHYKQEIAGLMVGCINDKSMSSRLWVALKCQHTDAKSYGPAADLSQSFKIYKGHQTIARCFDSWLTTADFQQGFNDWTMPGQKFISANKKIAPMVFYPSVKAFFYREEFMKKPLTSLIYVYRLLNRQVVSGAWGALNTST